MSQQYAMAAPAGSGPKGETCGSCAYCVRRDVGRRVYKCLLVVPRGSSPASDIRLKWLACSRWDAVPTVSLSRVTVKRVFR